MLVGGIPTPLKHVKVSWDDDIPYSQYMENKQCSKPPTSRLYGERTGYKWD